MCVNEIFSRSDDTPPTAATFTQQSGPKVSASIKTPEECFSLFFDTALLDFIVDNTNKYAQKRISSTTLTHRALYRNRKPVTRDELKGILAIKMNMGIIQLGDLKDYWSTDDVTDLPFFRSVFFHDRFFQIFGAFHVGDVDGSAKH